MPTRRWQAEETAHLVREAERLTRENFEAVYSPREFPVPMGVRAAEAIMEEQKAFEARILSESAPTLKNRMHSAERILAAGLIERAGSTYYVRSESTPNVFYRVSVVDGVPTCTCAFYVERKVACKHLLATAMQAQKETGGHVRRPTIAELRAEKKNHPERFCPDPQCVYRVDRISGFLPCPNHQRMLGPFKNLGPAEAAQAVADAMAKDGAA